MNAHQKQIKFLGINLEKIIEINKIYSLFYFERPRDFVFEGERHDFWEFLYVDKGEVEVVADTYCYQLRQGDIIFHKPNEFHSVCSNNKSTNFLVISFDCKSSAMSFLKNKIYSSSEKQTSLLSQILKKGMKVFSGYDNNKKILIRNQDAPFGYQQLLKNHMEELLIDIIHNGISQNKVLRINSNMKERVEKDLAQKVINFIKQNLYRNLTFEEICKENLVGETHLKILFKEQMGISVMRFYKKLKIEEAKKLIRNADYNITQISNMLNYSSIHYFSKDFKKTVNMTPTEYATSIKARLGERYQYPVL